MIPSFSNMTLGSGYVSPPQEAAVAAAKFVASGAASSYVAADLAWTGPSNITADDAAYATATTVSAGQNTQVIVGTMGANPLAIPTGARIDSVTVKLKGKLNSGTAPGAFRNTGLWPVIGGVIAGRNLFDALTGYGGTETELTYTLTPAQLGFQPTAAMLNSADFGFGSRFSRAGGSGTILSLNAESVSVNYTTNVFDDTALPGCLSTFTLPTTRTTSTVFDVIAPGITPAAALFLQGYTSSAEITGTNVTGTGTQAFRQRAATNFRFNMGVYSAASAAQYMVQTGADDGVMNSFRFQRSDRVAGGNSTSHVVNATGASSEKVSLAWSGAADNDKPVIAVPLAAGNTHLQIQDGVDPATTPYVDVTTGFFPRVLINVSGQEKKDSGSHGGYSGATFGVAVWNSTTGQYDQYCLAVMQFYAGYDGAGPYPEAALTAVECAAVLFTDRIHYNEDNGTAFSPVKSTFSWTVSDATSAGYRINFAGDNGAVVGDGASILALDWPGNSLQVGVAKLPRSTGVGDAFVPLTTIPFTPKLVIQAHSLLQSIDAVVRNSAQGGAFAMSVMDRKRAAMTGWTNENGAVSNVSSYMDLEGLRLIAGDQTTAFAAAPLGMKTGGASANVTTAAAADYYGIYLAVG